LQWSHAYDANNQLVEITDANGHVTSYQRDVLNRIVGITNPLGWSTGLAYDANGNILNQTKADGSVISYEYDALDRVIRTCYPDDTGMTFAYDAIGNLTEASYAGWSVQYTYDALNRRTRAEYPALDCSVEYTYDDVGNRQSLTVMNEKNRLHQVEYHYDATNRLAELIDMLNSSALHYTYDPAGNLTGISYPNNTRTSCVHNDNNWVTTVENLDHSSATMSAFAYTYDAVGNVTQIVRTTPSGSVTTSYDYDALNQLILETYPRYALAYAYDAAGNRTSRTDPQGTTRYTYDAADQLLQAGDTAFTYDANGNLTSRTDPHGMYSHAYDYDNHLISLRAPGNRLHTFNYDALGRRISRSGSEGAAWYIYDGMNPILEGNDSLSRGTAYTYGNGLLATSHSLSSGDSSVLSYHGDALGTVYNVADADGVSRAAYGYDAFGHQSRVAGLDENPYRFVGQLGVQMEEASGDLYLMGFRYYDAGTGRFLTHDPLPGFLRAPLSINQYLYVANNPITLMDPYGLQAFLGDWKFWAGLGLSSFGAGIAFTGLGAPLGAYAVKVGVGLMVAGGALDIYSVATTKPPEAATKLVNKINKQRQRQWQAVQQMNPVVGPLESQGQGVKPEKSTGKLSGPSN
jgi:RHS repeat-associated protein